MKICINCGAELKDETNFCPHCGSRCDQVKSIGSPASKAPEDADVTPVNTYPMKWHNFLMVVMIIGAVFTVINGIGVLLGTEYSKEGISAEQVYIAYPGLQLCDMVYGAAVIALGVFQFIARNRLKQYRENGPGSMKILYILSIAASLIYLVWASSVTSINLFNLTNLGSIGGSVALLIINSIYYSKRSELFVN